MKDFLYKFALNIGLCALFAGLPALAQDGADAPPSEGGSSGTKMLKAGVEHSETVQPLEPQLMPGQRFNANAVSMGAVVDEWICIPPWFAGTFEVNQSLVVSFIDYRARTQLTPNKMEKIYRTFHYGHQLDSNGRVWHLNRCPYRNSIESERSVQYNLIRKTKFLHSGNDSVLETATGPALVVTKDSGVIARSTTIETFGKFQPDSQGILKTTSIKGFNAAGMPEDLIVRQERARMIQPFAPDPSTAQSFALFMQQRAAQQQAQQQGQMGGAPYGQGAPYTQAAPYSQSSPYTQRSPYSQGQSSPYSQSSPYPQSTPFQQSAPYSQAAPYPQRNGN